MSYPIVLDLPPEGGIPTTIYTSRWVIIDTDRVNHRFSFSVKAPEGVSVKPVTTLSPLYIPHGFKLVPNDNLVEDILDTIEGGGAPVTVTPDNLASSVCFIISSESDLTPLSVTVTVLQQGI